MVLKKCAVIAGIGRGITIQDNEARLQKKEFIESDFYSCVYKHKSYRFLVMFVWLNFLKISRYTKKQISRYTSFFNFYIIKEKGREEIPVFFQGTVYFQSLSQVLPRSVNMSGVCLRVAGLRDSANIINL